MPSSQRGALLRCHGAVRTRGGAARSSLDDVGCECWHGCNLGVRRADGNPLPASRARTVRTEAHALGGLTQMCDPGLRAISGRAQPSVGRRHAHLPAVLLHEVRWDEESQPQRGIFSEDQRCHPHHLVNATWRILLTSFTPIGCQRLPVNASNSPSTVARYDPNESQMSKKAGARSPPPQSCRCRLEPAGLTLAQRSIAPPR